MRVSENALNRGWVGMGWWVSELVLGAYNTTTKGRQSTSTPGNSPLGFWYPVDWRDSVVLGPQIPGGLAGLSPFSLPVPCGLAGLRTFNPPGTLWTGGTQSFGQPGTL